MKQHKHQSIINRPREQPHIDIFIPQNFSGCQNGNGKGWNARHQILRHQCGKGCGQQNCGIIAKLPQHMHDTAIVQHRFKNRTENQRLLAYVWVESRVWNERAVLRFRIGGKTSHRRKAACPWQVLKEMLQWLTDGEPVELFPRSSPSATTSQHFFQVLSRVAVALQELFRCGKM